MKVTDKLTEAALAERLDEVLNRASQGEEFAIEREGEVIATIGPPNADSEATLRELALKLTQLPPLDDEFEADIEAVLANQRSPRIPEWPD
jgi:antitoxin (DNA-binding transcriptional repressor) of toxin-antitoxin stability system